MNKVLRVVSRVVTYPLTYALVRKKQESLLKLILDDWSRSYAQGTKFMFAMDNVGDTHLALSLMAGNCDCEDIVAVVKEKHAKVLSYFPDVRNIVLPESSPYWSWMSLTALPISFRLGLALAPFRRFSWDNRELVAVGAFGAGLLSYIRQNPGATLRGYYAHNMCLEDKIARPTVTSETEERALHLMRSLGVRPGKSVLLVPYSYSDKHWENERLAGFALLAKRLLGEGFDVCTNVGPGERELPGTVRAELPYDLVLPFANLCGYVYSVRCGIADIIASGFEGKRMVVFYPKLRGLLTLSRMTYMQFFSVARIYEKPEIEEYEFDGNAEQIATL